MAINIQGLLNEIGVPYWLSGKNVSAGWTSITCPMPGCSDRSNHGAFSPEGTAYSCFICGRHRISEVLKQFVSYKKVKRLLADYGSEYYVPETNNIERASFVKWPPTCAEKSLPSIHAEYLHSRKFNPKIVKDFYDIVGCYHTGFMKYRLVIPVYQNNRIVTYIGRDVTDKAILRYKNLPERKSILSVKECVYNIDAVDKKAIIVEGPTDTWRFKTHAVSTFGLQFTLSQINILANKLDEAIVCFDSQKQAQNKAEELAEALAFRNVKTYILSIDVDDPGELSQKEAEKIKKYVLKH